jgi:hypothetical protein
MASSGCRDDEREIRGMARAMGRARMIGPYVRLAQRYAEDRYGERSGDERQWSDTMGE